MALNHVNYSRINKTHIGLYRDDGLAVFNLPVPQLDTVRKDIIRINLNQNLTTNFRDSKFFKI